ncbi:outer membrane protein assembly factor BamE [Amylibacter sp. IMCC11727]|uniref:outer membrane protein assembly factor BamE domain-containing protein n=1 Tax=Amylibacter sp. IMCC11727 TaxID=3039851 RepID=UPI00244DF389|nr:outer membrane protein assembly factor BamE [Amylibacter sp. IMCC11727]WGI22145.1 outer membrane protein assembly factor BamE [Amylibacter sp. IMCC11727]
MKLPLILVAGLALSACTVGNIHNNKKLDGINSVQQARQAVRPGMSMQAVADLWGKPSFKNVQNNTTLWSYVNRNTVLKGNNLLGAAITGAAPANTKTVTVWFNASGRVNKVDYTEQSF